MTKAMMVSGVGAGQPSGSFLPSSVGESLAHTSTESVVQFSASEAATFSRLGYLISSGGSGTSNTMKFRKGGADGNQSVTRNGAGAAMDTSNSDSVSASDLIDLSWTDNGSNPQFAGYITQTVQFSSGHGCFYMAETVNGIFVANNEYMPINGQLYRNATESLLQFKSRAPGTWAAFQINVFSNSTSGTLKNRINGANGSGTITIGSSLTGIFTVTGLSDTIADGDLLNFISTVSAGSAMAITMVGCTLKSSGAKSDSIRLGNGNTRSASVNENFYPIGGNTATSNNTETNVSSPVGFSGTASNLRINLSANTYTGTSTLKLYKNGSAVITLSITAGATGWIENTSDTVSFVTEDLLSLGIDEGTSGSITIRGTGITLEDAASGAQSQAPRSMHQFRLRRA